MVVNGKHDETLGEEDDGAVKINSGELGLNR
jgi:hypothetical protein